MSNNGSTAVSRADLPLIHIYLLATGPKVKFPMFLVRADAEEPERVYYSGSSVFLSPTVGSFEFAKTLYLIVLFEEFDVLPLGNYNYPAQMLYRCLGVTSRKARGSQQELYYSWRRNSYRNLECVNSDIPRDDELEYSPHPTVPHGHCQFHKE